MDLVLLRSLVVTKNGLGKNGFWNVSKESTVHKLSK